MIDLSSLEKHWTITFLNAVSLLNHENQLSDVVGICSDQAYHYWLSLQLQLLGTTVIKSHKKPVLSSGITMFWCQKRTLFGNYYAFKIVSCIPSYEWG